MGKATGDQGYDWSALPSGARGAVGVPGLVMAGSFIGFGALLRGSGIELLPGVTTTVAIWALPGQVVMVSMLAQGAGLLVIAIAVTLTAVRLLPMVVLVISKVRLDGAARWPLYVLAHFIAVTAWVIATQNIDSLERRQRLPWLLGLGLTLMGTMVVVTCIGYYLADQLPAPMAACMVFFTPAFFLVSLFAAAAEMVDYLSIALGVVLLPAALYLVPEFDLLIAGVGGGTLAYLASRLGRKASE